MRLSSAALVLLRLAASNSAAHRAASNSAAQARDEQPDEAEQARSRLSLPFYLYTGPAFDAGQWFEPCARGLRGEGVTEDQYAGEHFFYAQLRAHRWRVADPRDALLFVVPLYANAAMQPSVKGSSCNGTHFQRLFDATAAAVASTEQYRRHAGADHVLVSNSWKVTQRPPKQVPWAPSQLPNDFFRRTFRNAIVGHMEARPVGSSRQKGGDQSGLSPFWRCSVVSPYTANYVEAARAHLRTPAAAARDISFFFQGGANNRGTYGYGLRQAALAQLEQLPRAHISAFSVPGKPGSFRPCRGAVTTNCRAAHSGEAFRGLMARARFNLVLRGDSPSTRRLYDGIAAGALTVFVSDQTWAVGLPFGCLVPWRRMAVTVSERVFATAEGAAATLEQLDALAPSHLARIQRTANRYRRDLLWNVNGSRVAENVLLTAALRCLPSHVTRAASSRAGGRASAVAHALRQLRQQCVHPDHTVACSVPDAANCLGCETGELAPNAPVEYCCADSCPTCNATAGRCLPREVYSGDPLLSDPARREAVEAALRLKVDDLPPEVQRWRGLVGQRGPPPPAGSAAPPAAKQPKQTKTPKQQRQGPKPKGSLGRDASQRDATRDASQRAEERRAWLGQQLQEEREEAAAAGVAAPATERTQAARAHRSTALAAQLSQHLAQMRARDDEVRAEGGAWDRPPPGAVKGLGLGPPGTERRGHASLRSLELLRTRSRNS
jgi:hypothetical protein